MARTSTHQSPQRFVYHGNAVGATVHLTRVGNTKARFIHSEYAQCSLPVIGGRSEPAPVKPRIPDNLRAVFDYDEAQTMADGQADSTGKSTTTIVQVLVKGVRITNRPEKGESESLEPIVFKAGVLSLAVRSRHPHEGRPSIDFIKRPVFQGLSLNDMPIKIKLNTELMRVTRWSDLQERLRTDRDFFERSRDSFELPDPKRRLVFGRKLSLAPGAHAHCSFVESVTWNGKVNRGHKLTVTGFGTIYFGEMLWNDRERRVAMVRIRLGSQNKGDSLLASADANGVWWPPR
jgi:hypothetical protein